jgi:hypothetical protein
MREHRGKLVKRIAYKQDCLQDRRAAYKVGILRHLRPRFLTLLGLQLFEKEAHRHQKQGDTLRNWNLKPLILTFGAWTEYVEQRKADRVLVSLFH